MPALVGSIAKVRTFSRVALASATISVFGAISTTLLNNGDMFPEHLAEL